MKSKMLLKILVGCCCIFGFGFPAFGTQGVSDTEIKLGSVTALSGPLAALGADITSGARFRFDEVNAAGGIYGRKITFIAEDSQYRVPIAVQKANKLINRDEVFATVADLGTPQWIAMFNIMEENNVPPLFPTSAARPMYTPFHKLKFLHSSSYIDNARAAVEYFVKEKNIKRPCMMHLDNDAGEEWLEGVSLQLAKRNLKLITKTTHKATDTNFVAAISKLRKSRCDAVFMGTVIRDTIIPMATARKMGWNVDFVTFSAGTSQITAEKGGPAVEGLYGVTSGPLLYPEDVTGQGKRIFEAFKKKHGNYPTAFTQIGYVFADLVVAGLQNAGRNLTTDSLIKGLEGIKNHPYAFIEDFTYSFGPTKHQGSNKSVLYKVKNKRWVSPVPGKLIVVLEY